MKDDQIYLLHIEECISDINTFVKGNRELFLNDKLVRNATLRSLQTLAESTSRLSDEFKEKHPDIPWRKIRGFRNVIVHDYLGLDYEAVWLVITVEIPRLRKILK
ncbi:MAG TPA: DUF86 domain-containing protein [Oligoflexus sp.]|uniref:HepT-like ribonuclease domain-containing protein n=1 Tax=Oligoflexus sp. TaxID=1971216 RepID=UPI002D8100BB|nr:DUF86 domain-containing protein [Oligoflexus sp.]HET9237454.1 DUF86 domain-containing protein [Oligoflexus sp.]